MTENILCDEAMFNLPAPYRMLQLFELAPGFYLPPHSHSFYHVNLVMTGCVVVTFEDKEYPIKAGQAFTLPPDIYHTISSPQGYSQIGIDIFQIQDERGIYNLFTETFPAGFAIVTLLTSLKSYEYIRRALRNLTTLNILKITNVVEHLVLTVIENSQHIKKSSFQEDFLSLMAQEYSYNLTLQQMCAHLNLSRTHLERQAKQAFGCGAMEYCHKLKLTKACQLLQLTDLSVRDICFSLNFYDESHFNRFFKTRMNITPYQYRLQYRKLL